MTASTERRKPKPEGDKKATIGTLPVWDLKDLYRSISDPAVQKDLDRAATDAEAFMQRYKGRLDEILETGGGGPLAEAIATFEALQERLGRLMSFAGLVYAGDTTDPERGKFYGDIQDKLTTISRSLLFFPLELNRIDDAAMEEALGNESLSYYAPWLRDLAREKPYQLSDEIERLFHDKNVTGRAAWNRIFDETLANLRFEVEGEVLTLEPTLNRMLHPDETKRRAASEAIGRTLHDNVHVFTLITNTLAKDKEISDRWRGFADVADARHLANRVEREIVEALVDAVREAYPRLSHRYYRMKAGWLGKEKLDHWDRNAPLPDAPDRIIPWTEAQSTVLSAYAGFEPRMAEIAERFFDRRWIDAPTRPGKAPGAFAHPTVPSVHPYVLLNYQGKPRDVMTLAHELGHGVHQVLAGEQGYLLSQTPLTLAETASVFGEMLTFRSLLQTMDDPRSRKAMLASKVEDMINTAVRQIAFYTFERKIHLERREGELTSERIGDIWRAVQGESLGPSVELGPGYEVFWAYVPHFVHSPFYVYAYAFGDCLVNSLYAVYENAEEGFQAKYLEMLKAGGAKHHRELLAPFGLDASDPAFWAKGLDLIARMIDELEALDRA